MATTKAPACDPVCGDQPIAPPVPPIPQCPPCAAQLFRQTQNVPPSPPNPPIVSGFDVVGYDIGTCLVPDVVTDDILVTEPGLYQISYTLLWNFNGIESEASSILTVNGGLVLSPEFNPAIAMVTVPADNTASASGVSIACLPAGTRIGLLLSQNSEADRFAQLIFLTVTRLECIECPPLPPPVPPTP